MRERSEEAPRGGDMSRKIVVIGAGMAGLAAGRLMSEKGYGVVLLDKGRGVGGRVATRRLDGHGERQGRWDHGAQSIVLRSGRLKSQLAQWGALSSLEPWSATREGVDRLRARNGLNTFAKALAVDLPIRKAERVVRLTRGPGCWHAICESGASFEGDAVLSTIPAPQLLDLLDASGLADLPGIAALDTILYTRNLTLLAEMDGPSGLPPPGVLYPDSDVLERIIDNAVKGISATHTITAQAHPAFSLAWYEQDREVVSAMMAESLGACVGCRVIASTIHGWKYAEATQRWPEACLEVGEGLWAAGDGFMAGDRDVPPSLPARVEAALLSGMAAAVAISAESTATVAEPPAVLA